MNAQIFKSISISKNNKLNEHFPDVFLVGQHKYKYGAPWKISSSQCKLNLMQIYQKAEIPKDIFGINTLTQNSE